jgi:hypothetical protein
VQVDFGSRAKPNAAWAMLSFTRAFAGAFTCEQANTVAKISDWRLRRFAPQPAANDDPYRMNPGRRQVRYILAADMDVVVVMPLPMAMMMMVIIGECRRRRA